MLNQVLTASIDAVMNAPSPAQFLLTLELLSKANPAFSFSPLIIDQLAISQDFDQKYTDDITIGFEIASADYAVVQDNVSDLMGVLTITTIDRNGTIAYTPPPQQTTFRATLVNPKDIRRQLSDVASRTTPDTTMMVRLIDQTVYDLRHIEVNTIWQKTTVADAIAHLAQTFNFKILHLVPPDNTHVYDHIIIPPTKGFDEVFTYLQTTYGVYMKGLHFYATNGILYIYPPYETKPDFPQTAIIYQADDGAYAGHQSFHKTTGPNTEIVVNRESQGQDLTIAAGENHGTAAIFLRSSAIVDGVVTVDPTKGAQYQDGLSATLRLQNPRMAASSTQNTSYAKSTDNPFAMATPLAAGQAVMMDIVWAHAVPFLFQPGCALSYNHDENGRQMTQSGILQGAQCILNRGDRLAAGTMYLSSGKLVLRLQPDATQTA